MNLYYMTFTYLDYFKVADKDRLFSFCNGMDSVGLDKKNTFDVAWNDFYMAYYNNFHKAGYLSVIALPQVI